jgi:hypothetical protein
MIQTSYYQKSWSLPNAVGISQSVPKWYGGKLDEPKVASPKGIQRKLESFV